MSAVLTATRLTRERHRDKILAILAEARPEATWDLVRDPAGHTVHVVAIVGGRRYATTLGIMALDMGAAEVASIIVKLFDDRKPLEAAPKAGS